MGRYYIALAQPRPNGNLERSLAVIPTNERVMGRVWYKGCGGTWVELRDVVFTSRGALWQRFAPENAPRPLFAPIMEVETVAELEKCMKESTY